jgi:ferric-dicitrate binding protein FerR (iron transport regulator)
MVVVVLGALFAWQMLRPARAVLDVATAPGETREVTLPDGSLAVLAAGSRLTVPIGFGPEHRTVRLEGEAWFHAMHEGHPFIVQSGNFVVRDVGTTFTVEGRRHRHFRVTVVDGAVEVRLVEASARLALLSRGDVADFHEDGALLAVHHDQPVEVRTAWRSGTLQFVDAPVMDVLERLSAWFGREIRIAPALTIGRTLTATFPTDSFDGTLEILASLLGVEVVPDNDNGVWLQ